MACGYNYGYRRMVSCIHTKIKQQIFEMNIIKTLFSMHSDNMALQSLLSSYFMYIVVYNISHSNGLKSSTYIIHISKRIQ